MAHWWELTGLIGRSFYFGWDERASFADNVYQLGGLDPEAASDLADAVLQRARAQDRRKESAFKDLMTLLAGYPLALQVVLPHLAAKTTATVLDELRRGLAEADAAPGPDPVLARTRSLMACIEYSHGHLDPDEQALLTCFAPFTGIINTDLLEPYREALAEEPALAGLPLDRLSEVLERARGLGLLQRDATIESFLRPQPALSWFLTGRLGAADQANRRHAIEHAFREHSVPRKPCLVAARAHEHQCLPASQPRQETAQLLALSFVETVRDRQRRRRHALQVVEDQQMTPAAKGRRHRLLLSGLAHRVERPGGVRRQHVRRQRPQDLRPRPSSEAELSDPENRDGRVADPQYYRDCAKEARVHADETQDSELKRIWLQIAEGFELQAELLQKLRNRRADLPPER